MVPDIIFPNITSTLQITGCHFGEKPPGWSYPKHHHHLYEVLYCQAGEARLLINSDELRLCPGDWLLIRAGARHEIVNRTIDEGCFSFFNIHFDIDDHEMRKSLSRSEYSFLPAQVAAATNLPSHVAEIELKMHQNLQESSLSPLEAETRLSLTPAQKTSLQAYILLIIHEIILLQPEAGDSVPEVTQDTTIRKADTAHLIEERLKHLISAEGSIAELAGELNMSRSQCSKIFKKVYGVSPRQYLTQLKLNLAKQLLVSTNNTVEDIADELGFHSVSHFSRQFRRGTGLSPNQFRPRHMT
ncbi:AraC family transcriptional regulator [Paenibacillus albidus]|uniref:AraC family transcriptional regulator n=1 Tax=Paenibacillus albidus TaxID=2041023 RepID=A0A917C385_9BACL|nr:AraC family transcriptional regulator [Paenibacillus albidus]GGF66766.1 AraC family transcriptional regulator [Paenibacillus albidus]